MCMVTYAYLTSSVSFSLTASDMQKMVMFWWKTLVSICVLFYFFLSIWKVFLGKVRPHDPNMHPQGAVWKDLVAQVLSLIQVNICPRHRLYPVSPCDNVQQEMPSYYPPLQYWVKSTKDAIKLIIRHCLSLGGKSMASWGLLLHSRTKK